MCREGGAEVSCVPDCASRRLQSFWSGLPQAAVLSSSQSSACIIHGSAPAFRGAARWARASTRLRSPRLGSRASRAQVLREGFEATWRRRVPRGGRAGGGGADGGRCVARRAPGSSWRRSDRPRGPSPAAREPAETRRALRARAVCKPHRASTLSGRERPD